MQGRRWDLAGRRWKELVDGEEVGRNGQGGEACREEMEEIMDGEEMKGLGREDREWFGGEMTE